MKRSLIVFVAMFIGVGVYAQLGCVGGQAPPAGAPPAGAPPARGQASPEQQAAAAAAQAALKAAIAKELELQKATPQLKITEEILSLVVPGRTIGETLGVAKNSKGHLFVFSRSGTVGIAKGSAASELFEFDPNLKFVKQWGPGNYAASYAHAVRVDKYDNVWMVDEGSNMVVKFNPQAQVTMVLGRRVESIDYLQRFLELGEKIESQYTTGAPNTFNRPTDVTWDTQDNIFVADGYNNSRVKKTDKGGNFVKSVGTRGSGQDQFNLPHSITSDAKGLIYVADRGNRRIQVYDPDLNFVKTISGMGAPWGICVTPGSTQYLWSGDSNGKVFKLDLNGKLLGWGQTRLNHGQASCMVHSIHCESENVIYTGDCSMWMVEKLTIK